MKCTSVGKFLNEKFLEQFKWKVAEFQVDFDSAD